MNCALKRDVNFIFDYLPEQQRLLWIKREFEPDSEEQKQPNHNNFAAFTMNSAASEEKPAESAPNCIFKRVKKPRGNMRGRRQRQEDSDDEDKDKNSDDSEKEEGEEEESAVVRIERQKNHRGGIQTSEGARGGIHQSLLNK
jgi:hypothetical protein